ncbi:hypothetical protein Pint_07694 [Pistacia integerrima]|uniref:Uncharacterized protein n=1 Tax=Pistacia integerrima TaxID=434235 RepID=A0ACC0XX18_9ROSI|nr:hypothetical protein Pint_07694 [Pistacia integerrima]
MALFTLEPGELEQQFEVLWKSVERVNWHVDVRFENASFGSCNHMMSREKGRRYRKVSKSKWELTASYELARSAPVAKKWLPLHTLAASGEFYLVDALLKHNVDINAVDKDGLQFTKLSLGRSRQLPTLLRESVNPFVCDDNGATLLHYAVQTASSPAIKILLLYNVDLNLQDNDGWTPLHLAVQARRTDIVKLLLIKGTDKTLKNLPIVPLHFYFISVLLGNILICTFQDEWTPLHLAVQARRTDIVKLLLIKGADKTLKNLEGLTPLDLCLYSGEDTRTYELIKLLKQLPKRR